MKDTTDFLRKLYAIKFVLDNAYLVSLDVKSLYASIPKIEGMKAIKKPFYKHTNKNVATKVMKFFYCYSNIKQLCVHLQVLTSNKRLCYGYDIRIILCKYLYESL